MFDIFQTIFRYKEKESPDQLGYFPERVHVEAMPERRYLWTSRLLVIISSLSISLSMALASTIYLLLPQKHSSPLLLQTNNYFSYLEPTDTAIRKKAVLELLSEAYIEEYIALRNVISNDYDEMMERWAPGSQLYWMSSRPIFQFFTETEVPFNINQFKANGLMRLVEMEWAKPLSKGFWMAQFITVDSYPNREKPSISLWRAYVRFSFVSVGDNYKEFKNANPFGFVVSSYSLSYLGTPDKPESYLDTARDIRAQNYAY